MKFPSYLLYILSPLFALAIWEGLAQADWIDRRFFPEPSKILHYLFFVSPSEGLFSDIGASLYRIFWGYSGGVVLGLCAGILLGLNKPLRSLFYPLIAATYPLPKIAILPLVMLIFGIGELSKIVLVGIGAFFLIFMNTLSGVEHIPKIYHDVNTVYRISFKARFLYIVLPAILPSLFTGLKLALGYSLVIVVAAEFSGASSGVGYMIWQSWETFSIVRMYAGIFTLAILGLIFSLSIEALEKRCIPWSGNYRR